MMSLRSTNVSVLLMLLPSVTKEIERITWQYAMVHYLSTSLRKHRIFVINVFQIQNIISAFLKSCLNGEKSVREVLILVCLCIFAYAHLWVYVSVWYCVRSCTHVLLINVSTFIIFVCPFTVSFVHVYKKLRWVAMETGILVSKGSGKREQCGCQERL